MRTHAQCMENKLEKLWFTFL